MTRQKLSRCSCSKHPHLGLGQGEDEAAELGALIHVDGVQLGVAQLAEARALQVGLPQAERRRRLDTPFGARTR